MTTTKRSITEQICDPAPTERHRDLIVDLCVEYGWSGVLEMVADWLREDGMAKTADDVQAIAGPKRWP